MKVIRFRMISIQIMKNYRIQFENHENNENNEFHTRITKIMKIQIFPSENNGNHKNHRSPYGNQENHVNLRMQC